MEKTKLRKYDSEKFSPKKKYFIVLNNENISNSFYDNFERKFCLDDLLFEHQDYNLLEKDKNLTIFQNKYDSNDFKIILESQLLTPKELREGFIL